MDTNWNSTDKDPGGALEQFVAEEVREAVEAGKGVRVLRPGGRVKALAGFLAFFLGMTLALSALGALGNRIAWERDPSPRWEWDWQETDAFRDEVSHYLREFLTIGAGGTVDFYDGAYYWDGGYNSAVVVEQEAIRTWWGFGEAAEATRVEQGTLESVPPAEPEKELEKEPDAAYQADKNVLYYIRNGEIKNGKVYSNMDAGLDKLLARSVEGYNFYLQFVNGRVSIFKDGQIRDVYGDGYYDGDSRWFVPGYDNFPVSEQLEGVKVVMAVRETPIPYYSADYKTGGTSYYSAFYSLARQVEESESFYYTQGLLLFIAMWCLVLWAQLRKSVEPVNRKIASWTDHVWTEVRFLLAAACLLWAFLPGLCNLDVVYKLLYSYGWEGGYSFAAWGMAVLRLVTMNVPALIALFWLWRLLRNDHKHNPGEVRRSLLRALFRSLRARDLKRPVEKRLSRSGGLVLLVLLAGFVLSLFPMAVLVNFVRTHPGIWGWCLLLLACLLEVLLVWALCCAWWSRGLARDIAALADQVEAVRAGDLERPLVLPEDADLRQTAESLNDIQAGMRAALAEQTRSERMKVELVSNVSHDLKTPLTSILSYAELLRQEDLPPAAADYAKIIDQKAQRLKTMVEDVFDISKAAADQLPVHLERLDLGKLLRQTLADMDGPIQASALTFKAELPEEPVMITADGRRLYRVFQNLLDNALRYALEGSRVYLRLKTAEGTAEASVRSTSRTELPEGVDFTARFVRGDASRTDGGSGLGLSIAKSFTEACGGSFRVETVADLFTAVVTFPTEQEGQEA
ncbi:HAMP domain-containing sensor histidine kinase [uncultured Oscillibacter sp.]|uniref:sensor histidine kinase n=2 Tax=Oscillibacter TaxID=459786 RepID=UPI00266F8E8B|nr:HAMP domain-containing sensor histidine kinase [uncultured Oscillibacter sp.]